MTKLTSVRNVFLDCEYPFSGAHAAPDTAAELAAEAAEPKEPGEVEREAAKTPDELADEALEAARDGEL